MIESQTDIDGILEDLGETLTFIAYPEFSIKVIPGFQTVKLYDSVGGVAQVDRNDYSFTTSSKNIQTYNVRLDQKCYYSDAYYKYQFIINSNPMPDTLGWSKLQVILDKVTKL